MGNNLVTWVCLISLLLFCMVQAVVPYSMDNRQQPAPQPLQQEVPNNSLIGQRIPTLKMMKRILRNFAIGRTATITAVFQSDIPVDIIWYKEDPKTSREVDEELFGLLPIPKGDRDYVLSEMKSGTVVASTVSIPAYDGRKITLKLILSGRDGTQQYQLDTVVGGPQRDSMEAIDSPEWMIAPQPTQTYEKGGRMGVQCKIFVPHDVAFQNNELRMNRALPNLKDPRDIQTVLAVHGEANKSVALQDSDEKLILYNGELYETRGHSMYSVTVNVNRANDTHQGVYQCEMLRESDRAYISSTITMRGAKSLFPANPKPEWLPCNRLPSSHRNSNSKRMMIHRNDETCVRCRGYGFPRPDVSIYRGGLEMSEAGVGEVKVFKYINVPHAGVSEATYLIRHPLPSINGNYSCKATNDIGSDQTYFEIRYNRYKRGGRNS